MTQIVEHHIKNYNAGNANAIGTTPVRLNSRQGDRAVLMVQNLGAVDYYLGGPDVATSGPDRGRLLKGGQAEPAEFVDEATGVDWYAIAAADGGDLWVDELY